MMRRSVSATMCYFAAGGPWGGGCRRHFFRSGAGCKGVSKPSNLERPTPRSCFLYGISDGGATYLYRRWRHLLLPALPPTPYYSRPCANAACVAADASLTSCCEHAHTPISDGESISVRQHFALDRPAF
ncbi:hypothetical protein IE81DRAFT_183274 [Ceraceosorus guamensis]|uniref:Uncharacterized protein n=1 Tax=Ceraceosorus guamensis TaxID=1522189 RepID=A0A316VUI0_9BASI|nr:hypothetical protein IE81DRAFT_183274 [Ceraceosorus guamensis]PWN41276.1 hypothetical protein IE81DRAFT_183274 [Ceraceosorus guamensis]